jgi:MFS family permease
MNPKKLSLPLMLIALPNIFLGVLLPMYTNELGYTTFQYSITVSALACSQIIMKLILGKVSDRYSRRFIFISSFLCFAVTYFMFSMATQLSIIIVARVINGISGILLTMATVGLISDSNNSFGQQMGFFDSKEQIGGLIGVGVCYLVLSNYDFIKGWNVLFMICGGAAALAALYAFKLPKETKRLANTSKQKAKLSLKQRKIWMLNLYICAVASMTGVIFIPYMQKVYDASMELMTIVFLVPMILFPFINAKLGRVGDRKGYRKTIFVTTVACSLGALGLAFSPTLLIFAIVCTLFDIFASIKGYAIDALFIQGTPQTQIGDAFGKFSISNNLGWMIGAAFGGYLFDAFGFNVPYIAFAVLMLLFIPCALYLIPRNQDDTRNKMIA